MNSNNETPNLPEKNSEEEVNKIPKEHIEILDYLTRDFFNYAFEMTVKALEKYPLTEKEIEYLDKHIKWTKRKYDPKDSKFPEHIAYEMVKESLEYVEKLEGKNNLDEPKNNSE